MEALDNCVFLTDAKVPTTTRSPTQFGLNYRLAGLKRLFDEVTFLQTELHKINIERGCVE